VKSESGVTFGLAAVRITWIAAFVFCVLAILSGFLSGTDGDSSQQLPEFAFADRGDAPQLLPESVWLDPAPAMATRTAAAQADRSERDQEQALGRSDSGTHAPNRTGSQPEAPDGETSPGTSRPNPPQAPVVTQPDRPESPSATPPSPPEEPSGNPTPSEATVEVSVAESKVSVSASQESISAQVQTPVGSTDVTVGLS
jgi:hypothetical protein